MTKLNTPLKIQEETKCSAVNVYDKDMVYIFRVECENPGNVEKFKEIFRRANAYEELVAGILNAKRILTQHHNASVCPPIAGVICQACCNGMEEKPNVKKFFDLVTKLTNEEK